MREASSIVVKRPRSGGRILQIAGLLVLLASGQPSRAEGPADDLARFVAGEHSPQNLIIFPDVEGKVEVTVFCAVLVGKLGQLSYNTCYGERGGGDVRVFELAVADAVKAAKATPATVSGKPRNAWMHYRVEFVRTSDDASVSVYPNFGLDSDRFGPSYEAPQRLERLNRRGGYACLQDLDDAVFVALAIDEFGQASTDPVIQMIDGGKVGPICQRYTKQSYRRAEYMPGRNDGQPVNSTYVEIWDR